MKKCRQWAEEEKERIGHPLTMSIQTLGCQMNAKDSEKMTAILEYIGYKEVEEHPGRLKGSEDPRYDEQVSYRILECVRRGCNPNAVHRGIHGSAAGYH